MDILMHLTKCAEGSMVASARIARFVSEQLDIPLTHLKEQLPTLLDDAEFEGVDRFMLVNSPTGFADPEMRDACAVLSHLAKRSIFIQNDYKIKPPSQCKRVAMERYGSCKGESSDFYGMELWSTVPAIPTSTKVTYINWNQLTYTPSHLTDTPMADREPGLVYWGALRKGREERLQRLLGGLPQVTLSTAPQSVGKFREWLPEASYVPQFKQLHPELCKYRATLYTQDEYSDSVYCSPANRFYEALAAGMAIFIDATCADTFKTAGLTGYQDFVVDDAMDIELMLDDCEEIGKLQWDLWSGAYKQSLAERLKEIS